MRVRDYEYNVPDYEGYITPQRKKEIIDKLQSKYYKKDNTIPLHEVLKITRSDDECLFMYDWCDNHNIVIRGMNGTISGNITNYEELIRKPKHYPEIIPLEEQTKYFEKIEAGDKEARKEFIAKNIKLANWVVNKLKARRLSKKDMSKEEQLSYAYEGLIKAVDKFDYKKTYTDSEGKERHYAFSTYAVPTIYNTILREYVLQRRDETGFGISTLELMDLISNVEEEFTSLGCEATNEDISNIIGINPQVIAEKRKMIELVKDIKENESVESISEKELDNNFLDNVEDGAKVSITPNGYVVDGVYVEPDKEVAKKQVTGTGMDNSELNLSVEDINDWSQFREQLNNVLSTLTNREEKVIKIRFGLDGHKETTLEDTGRIFNVTRERIRQIEAKALRKLRHHSRSEKIKPYLNNTHLALVPKVYTRYVVPNRGLDIYPKTEYIENESLGEFEEMLDEINNSNVDQTLENTNENKNISNDNISSAEEVAATEINVNKNDTQESLLDETINNYKLRIETQKQLQQAKQERVEKLQLLESLMKKSRELEIKEKDIDSEIAEIEKRILGNKGRTEGHINE